MTGRRPKQRDRFTVGIERSADGYARKHFGGTALAEFQKARAIERALADTPYRVPHAIACDVESGYLHYEFVEGTVLLQELLEQAFQRRRFHRLLKLNDAAAQLLSVLHNRLELPNARIWQAPGFVTNRVAGNFQAEPPEVILHCDFSPVNLLVDEKNSLTVIDSSPNRYFTTDTWVCGPRIVDLATYTAKLIWPFRMRSFHFGWRKLATVLRRRFILTYSQLTGASIDYRTLCAYESALIHSFVAWKTDNRLLRSVAIGVERLGFHRPLSESDEGSRYCR